MVNVQQCWPPGMVVNHNLQVRPITALEYLSRNREKRAAKAPLQKYAARDIIVRTVDLASGRGKNKMSKDDRANSTTLTHDRFCYCCAQIARAGNTTYTHAVSVVVICHFLFIVKCFLKSPFFSFSILNQTI